MPSQKASLYQKVMNRFVVDGTAQHYAQLAVDLGVCPSAARASLHEVAAMALPKWDPPLGKLHSMLSEQGEQLTFEPGSQPDECGARPD